MCFMTSVLALTNLEVLIFTWMLLRCVQRRVRTRIVRSTGRRAGRRRAGRRRKRNMAVLTKIKINLWQVATKFKTRSRVCEE